MQRGGGKNKTKLSGCRVAKWQKKATTDCIATPSTGSSCFPMAAPHPTGQTCVGHRSAWRQCPERFSAAKAASVSRLFTLTISLMRGSLRFFLALWDADRRSQLVDDRPSTPSPQRCAVRRADFADSRVSRINQVWPCKGSLWWQFYLIAFWLLASDLRLGPWGSSHVVHFNWKQWTSRVSSLQAPMTSFIIRPIDSIGNCGCRPSTNRRLIALTVWRTGNQVDRSAKHLTEHNQIDTQMLNGL